MAGDGVGAWPAHNYRADPWRSSGRGPKADRMFDQVQVSLPPHIAKLDLRMSKETELAVIDASAAVAALTAGPGAHLTGLGSFLIRTESVASSKIERVSASRNDFAKAVAGIRSSADAKATLAAVTALQKMVDDAGQTGTIQLSMLLGAHRLLLEHDSEEKAYAGRVRDMQNWIGGSDYSPRGAVHVPPPPEVVGGLLDDLLLYSNRMDVPALTQAAIAHAQFESIHPFTDGNGRIGRGLISAILRRRSLASTTVVPIASAMLADVDLYFEKVNAYREGAADEFVRYLAQATTRAVEAAVEAAEVLAELPARWREMAKPRGRSTEDKLIPLLVANPVVTVSDVQRLTGSTDKPASDACERLTTAGVLTLLTQSARDRAWMATDVLDEIDEMNRRVGQRQPPKPLSGR